MNQVRENGGQDLERRQFTGFVGQKFNEDGSVREFPGNTVISKITPDMAEYAGLVEIQDRLRAMDVNGEYGFLPTSSLHMTVIEGVCDQVRSPERWSSKLSVDIPLPEVDRLLLDCWPRLSPPETINMRVARASFGRLLLIILEPADEATSKSLKDFRDRFAEETGIRFPNHDTYTFHISLAYNLIHLSPEEELLFQHAQEEMGRELSARYPILKLRKPDLTAFRDMFRFDNMC